MEAETIQQILPYLQMAMSMYGNEETNTTSNQEEQTQSPWGTLGQYMPAIGTLLGNIPAQMEYNRTLDYQLPYYDAGSYSSGGFTAGGYRNLQSNATDKLNRYKQRQKDLANTNAMFMQKYNLPKLDYNKYVPQETTYDFTEITTPKEFITGDFTQRDFLNNDTDRKSFLRGY